MEPQSSFVVELLHPTQQCRFIQEHIEKSPRLSPTAIGIAKPTCGLQSGYSLRTDDFRPMAGGPALNR